MADTLQQPGLWARIREHKLIQATLAYLAASLAIAHGEELLGRAFEWPEIVSRLVIYALALGLPLTLLIVFAATSRPSASDRANAGRTLDRIFLVVLGLIVVGLAGQRLLHIGGDVRTMIGRYLDVALGLLVVALLVDRLRQAGHARQPASGRGGTVDPACPAQAAPAATTVTAMGTAAPTATAAPIPVSASPAAPRAPPTARSVAVLPFTNLSADPDQEYFSDGLTEELINHLVQVRGLRVPARTSSFAFKGRNEDLRTVGETLAVSHVLEGSVRKAGNRLRITAQLIGCADGYHLWSQAFDRDLDDIFAIQNDISRAVAEALGIALGISDAPPPGGTRDLQAYELYLRAGSLLRQFSPADIRRAAQLCREALALDPEFSLAYTRLAQTLGMITNYDPGETDRIAAEWNHAVERALALAPDLGLSRTAHAEQCIFRKRWAEAEHIVQQAREVLPPSDPNLTLDLVGLLGSVGRAREAIGHLETARAVDPLSLILSTLLQLMLTIAGRDPEAEAEYRRTQDLEGNREAIENMALHRAWIREPSPGARQERIRYFLGHVVVPMAVESELVQLVDRPEVARAQLRQASEDPANRDHMRQFKLSMWAALFDDVDLVLATARRALIDAAASVGAYVLYLPAFRKVRQDPCFKDLLRDLKIVDYWRETGKWGDFARPKGPDDFEVW